MTSEVSERLAQFAELLGETIEPRAPRSRKR
jgi:hypothetical protein